MPLRYVLINFGPLPMKFFLKKRYILILSENTNYEFDVFLMTAQSIFRYKSIFTYWTR